MADKIKFTFLGTGSAIPTARRNHISMLLQYRDENILFDCGEGTQRQFRKAKLNPCKVTRILISHWHGDHVLGLPGLLQTLNLNGYNGELIIYGPKGSKVKFKEMVAPYLGFYWNVSKKNGHKFDIVMKEIDEGTLFETSEFSIEALKMDHDCPALAYSFVTKKRNRLDRKKLAKLKLPNSPLLGELVKGKKVKVDGRVIDGKKLMYTEPSRKISIVTDTRDTPNAVKISKNADVLVSEANYSNEEIEIARDHGHLTSECASKIAKKAGAKRLILTHLSQRYDMIPKKILGEAKEVFKNVSVAEDLDSFEL